MARILIVDDDSLMRSLLCELLEREGHVCAEAGDVANARKLLSENNFELVLCDLRMPGESGLDFILDEAARPRDTAVMMISGVDDPETARTTLAAGAYGYIIKPFEPNQVLINVASALRRRELEVTARRHQEDLEKIVLERTSELRLLSEKLDRTLTGVIHTMAMTVEKRDPYTAGHQKRVAELAAAIARHLGLSDEVVKGIHTTGLLHDLGKISIPAEILSKPGELTETEFALLKEHPRIGHDLLKEIEFPWPVAEIILQHHERLDGSGYPAGLSGNSIRIEASILAVADTVEAVASHRPYRPALGVEVALESIESAKGLLFDPDTVESCLTLFRREKYKL